MRRFASLRRQADFARLRQRGRRSGSSIFSLYRGDPSAGDLKPLVGVTVAKTVGNAVARNRLRRRFMAILDECLDGRPARLLIVARVGAAGTTFANLREQVLTALH